MITEKGRILHLCVFAVLVLNGTRLVSCQSNELLEAYADMSHLCTEAGDLSSHLPDYIRKETNDFLTGDPRYHERLVYLRKKILQQLSCVHWTLKQSNPDVEKKKKMLFAAIYIGYLFSYYTSFFQKQICARLEARMTFHREEVEGGISDIEESFGVEEIMNGVFSYMAVIAFFTPYDAIISKLVEDKAIVKNDTVKNALKSIDTISMMIWDPDPEYDDTEEDNEEETIEMAMQNLDVTEKVTEMFKYMKEVDFTKEMKYVNEFAKTFIPNSSKIEEQTDEKGKQIKTTDSDGFFLPTSMPTVLVGKDRKMFSEGLINLHKELFISTEKCIPTEILKKMLEFEKNWAASSSDTEK